ncbi:Clp protease ClpP [Pediococcus ethanolidurans]|uniref:head maturation protease, ClpP-related n=1 Tax=Pediococcus ethanolidurans TaxID=319653 RepID=UPI001C1F07C9|nr:head maturation protease, ClpP-related [Pediococcus ethanolidurans]MBU7554451.1 Clp protease ClpP [Pediococcus ethanolidurans]MBU7562661.1 Clp protease ClpP [Pediococcus ethanolidurans]MCV3315437.1 Clp protease ClpP [Pediococcus ethanolidurans]MCV3327679.1 Clp protease ClpP [Pediococcus ethanolidurans]
MTVKIPIKGEVMDSDWGTILDNVGIANVNPASFQKALNDANGDDVELDIASSGGIVESAAEIASLIHDYSGKVTTVVQGAAYSAASVIAVSGDVVKMAPTSLMMIHRASTQSAGNTNDLSHDATMLATVDKALSAAYQAKTGKSQEEVLNLMNNETWLTAQDAVDQGFADEVQENDKELAVTNSLSPLISKQAIEKLKALSTAKIDDVKNSHQSILNNKLKILKEE